MNEDKLGERLAAFFVLLADLVDELGGAKLIRNIHIESGILARGMAIQGCRHRDIGEEAGPCRLFPGVLDVAREFEPLTEVPEDDAVPFQMMPDGSGLQLLFRMDRRIAFREQ